MEDRQRAFTLSEVLIALALLGVVAAFVIPKVLQSQANYQRNALLKETYSIFAQILHEGSLKNELTDTGSSQYFMSRINAAKVCPTNASTEGCWDVDKQGTIWNEEFRPGIILPNGVRVCGMNDMKDASLYGGSAAYGLADGVAIDWNGIEGPNKIGEDQLVVLMCAEPLTKQCKFGDNLNAGGKMAAYIVPNQPANSAENMANQALFQAMLGH